MTPTVPVRPRAREGGAYVTWGSRKADELWEKKMAREAAAIRQQEIDHLEERIAKAIEWFKQADPDGSFYFQYRDGKLRSFSRMPSLEGTPRHEEWKRYATNMDAYEQLMKKLERLERAA